SILNGFAYPIHPTTWTVLPALVLAFAIQNKKDNLAISAAIFLNFFKELYPFGSLGLAGFFLIQRKYLKASLLFIISCLHLYLVVIVRPKIIGDSVSYGDNFYGGLLREPITYLLNSLQNFDYIRFLKSFYPFFIPLFLIVKNEIKKLEDLRNHPLTAMILYLGPLFALHFFPNLLMMHRESTFGAYLFGLIFFSPTMSV